MSSGSSARTCPVGGRSRTGWWLPGGKATSISQFGSAALAAGLLVWSYRKFHGNPEAIAAVEAAAKADDDREHFWGD